MLPRQSNGKTQPVAAQKGRLSGRKAMVLITN